MHAPARADDPAQDDVRRWFLSLGSEARLPLVTGFREEGVNSGTFCALAPASYREEALKGPGWNLMRGSHAPGFVVERGAADAEVTTYLDNSSAPVEPLVIDRTFHGVRPAYRELAQEFRLFHNLYADPASGRLWKFDDAGNETLAGELAADHVWILTSLVRQYQAARQLDLLLFIDSGVYFDSALPVPASEEWITSELNARLSVGEADHRPLSRYLATRIIPPPPIEASGIWPFEAADTYFPDFIVGTDDLGNPIRFSCDPDNLANYFGANPNAPNYLTPVHFRREVLVKYFDRPELYRVEDGYLRCRDLWGLRMDNDSSGSVIVWLGDLGLYLPMGERDYWRSFNIAPVREISDSTYRRAILGEFAGSESDDLRFRSIYRRLDRAWIARFGWPIFRTPEPGDVHLLDAVRLPLHDSEAELEDAVRTLTKLLVDSLNEAEIARALSPGPDEERGISKLARWLTTSGYPETDRDIAFLRGLQEVRSKGTAHRKGRDYEKSLDRTFGDKRKGEAVHDLLRRAVTMLEGMLAFAAMDGGTTQRPS